jgi:BirA family biotin operon repressor/biotin-[acetyl-CoA-carboxylase] ligase
MKDKRVRFIAGAADSGTAVEGILRGIGPDGELLIALDGEDDPRSFITGELDVYSVDS